MSVSLRVVDEAVRIVKQTSQLTLHNATHHANTSLEPMVKRELARLDARELGHWEEPQR